MSPELTEKLNAIKNDGKKKPHFAILVRVSTGDQNYSMQKTQCEEYAKKCGFTYEIFEEKESTRGTRPIKQKLMNRLRKKEFDGVLVYSLSRWERSLKIIVSDMQEFIDKGIVFVSLKENIDFSTATGKLQFHIIAAFCDFEREIIRERTIDGLKRARAEGKTLGRPPRVYEEKGNRSKKNYQERWDIYHEAMESIKNSTDANHITNDLLKHKQKKIRVSAIRKLQELQLQGAV
ncbi:MAG: recombinase family protein [Candidatus Omnitrophica bacterium]|nr:recombinase family protein [Candidatus Omnitrophota bacterium]